MQDLRRHRHQTADRDAIDRDGMTAVPPPNPATIDPTTGAIVPPDRVQPAAVDDTADTATAAELRRIDGRRPFRVGLVIGVVVAVAAALAVVQNGHRTTFDWLWFDFRAPLWLLLAATFAAGAIVAEAVRAMGRRARVRSARRHEALRAAQGRLVPPSR